MNCCNAFGMCQQGCDCPARVAKVGQRMPGPEPLPEPTWRVRLGDAAAALLAVVLAFAASTFVVLL